MQRILLIGVLVLAANLAAACSSNPVAPAAPAGSIGATVQTDGGTYTNIHPQELKAMLDPKDFVFVNTHIPYEGEIEPTDAFVPYDALDENLGKLSADKNAKIVLYDRSDCMSTIAAQRRETANLRESFSLSMQIRQGISFAQARLIKP